VLEIARQMPTATRVAGFWTWKNLGRSVNAGAKGIRIWAITGSSSTTKTTRLVSGIRSSLGTKSYTDASLRIALPDQRPASGNVEC
jgi:hypothetical protein